MKKLFAIFLVSIISLAAFAEQPAATASQTTSEPTVQAENSAAAKPEAAEKPSATAATESELAAAPADTAVVEKKLTPEEIEHQKEVAKRDKQAVKEAYELKGKMRNFIHSIVGDDDAAMQLLSREFFGLRVSQYLLVLLALAATFVFTRYMLGYLLKFLERSFSRDGSENFASLFFRKIRTPAMVCAAVVGLYFACVVVVEEKESIKILNRAAAVVFWLGAFWLILNIFDVFFMRMETAFGGKSASAASLINFLRKVVKSIITIIALLSILDNIGANVNAILASLGIGGMALAFASQDTIANFFGSVSIIIDRPFIVGDWIQTLSYEGNVEAIGFRSTRIRTFTKTLVTIPNSVLAKSSVENFSRMPMRKAVEVIGFTYDATADQLEAVIPEIKAAVLATDGVDKNSVSVRFAGFGDSSLNIRLVYYTKKINYDFHMDVRAKIDFAIMRIAAARGLSFAFPSTSVYVESLPSGFGAATSAPQNPPAAKA